MPRSSDPFRGSGGGHSRDLLRPPALQLRVNDQAYTDRLVSFLGSLGHPAFVAGPTSIELENEIDETELVIYLRVWNVLYPEAHAAVAED